MTGNAAYPNLAKIKKKIKKEKNAMNLSPESSFDSFDEDFHKNKEHQTSWLCIILTTGRFFICPEKGRKKLTNIILF